MATELEKARDNYRLERNTAYEGNYVSAEALAARRYIAQLEQKVAELEARIRNRGRKGHW